MSRRTAYLVALLAGAATALGFAPLDAWPLGLAGLAVLIWLVGQARRPGTAALTGWLFGIGMFAVSLNWIATAFTFQAKMPSALGWVAVLGLSLYLALFVAAPAGLATAMARGPAPRAALLAALWIPAEWLRGLALTGFAWNPLGALWLEVPGAAQLGSLVGGIGLSLMALLTAAGLLWLALGPDMRLRLLGGGLVAGAAASALVGAGMVRETGFIGPQLVVVQPGIGQGERYDADAAERHLQTYLALTRAALARGDGNGGDVLAPPPVAPADADPLAEPSGLAAGPGDATTAEALSPGTVAAGLSDPAADAGGAAAIAPQAAASLILWPEGAIDALVERDAATRQRIASVLRPGDLLLAGGTGISSDGSPGRYANSLFVIDAAARIIGRYDKAHLVPLGEYVPWRWALEPLGIARLVPGDYDFAAGPGPRTLALPGFVGVSPMICYEIAFPGAVTDPAARPGWIANVSNDAWFGAWGPPQHLAQARLRAIEEGLPIARATPTGISAVIDGHGRVLARASIGVAETVVSALPPPLPETLFSRFGPVPALVGALLLVLVAVSSDRLQRNASLRAGSSQFQPGP